MTLEIYLLIYKNTMKEKLIEKWIIQYLGLKGAVVEGMQSGSIMVVKGTYKNKMNLQSEGCPDITCFYKWVYMWIEVKKDQAEVEHWLKKENRYDKGFEIPKSYHREEMQIKYKQKILRNWGIFILTCELREVIQFIESLDKKSPN